LQSYLGIVESRATRLSSPTPSVSSPCTSFNRSPSWRAQLGGLLGIARRSGQPPRTPLIKHDTIDTSTYPPRLAAGRLHEPRARGTGLPKRSFFTCGHDGVDITVVRGRGVTPCSIERAGKEHAHEMTLWHVRRPTRAVPGGVETGRDHLLASPRTALTASAWCSRTCVDSRRSPSPRTSRGPDLKWVLASSPQAGEASIREGVRRAMDSQHRHSRRRNRGAPVDRGTHNGSRS